MGSSSIILNTGSTLLFKHNTASGQGGAIYADTCTLSQTGLCVFKHINSSLHPDDWGVNITFIDNRIFWYHLALSNAIYVNSVQSFLNNTFCWKGWFYFNSFGVNEYCIWQLRSGPVYYVNSSQLEYTVCSGDFLYKHWVFEMHDAWGNFVIYSHYREKILLEFVNGPAFTYNKPSTLSSIILANTSHYNHTKQTSLLYIHPLQFPRLAVIIHFKRCGDHYCRCYEQTHASSHGSYSLQINTCRSPGKHPWSLPFFIHLCLS